MIYLVKSFKGPVAEFKFIISYKVLVYVGKKHDAIISLDSPVMNLELS